MVKRIVILLFALLAFTSLVDSQLPCAEFEFQDKQFNIINFLVHVASKTGLLSWGLKKVDPLLIENNRLDAIPFSVLGSNFTLTPVIKQMNITGLSTAIPRSIHVNSSRNLEVGVDFDGTVTVTSTLLFEIQQVNRQWWQLCWTSIYDPSSCPPKVIGVEFGAGVSKPSMGLNLLISILQCNAIAIEQGTCKDLSVIDIVNATLHQKFDGLFQRVVRRFHTVSVETIQISFHEITELYFNFATSGQLITALREKLLRFTISEINKKEVMYRDLIQLANKLVKDLGNQVLQQKLQPLFGKSCYDL